MPREIILECLRRGQVLYPILKICLAFLIMHNPQVERDCTVQNIVSSTLRDAAERAGISDSRISANLGRHDIGAMVS